MQRKAILVLLCLLMDGCGFGGIRLGFPGVYRIDIPQGNVITQEMVDKLQPGMTKRQVRFVMGTPLIIDTFNQERWDYLHSMDVKGSPRTQENLSLFFDKDALVRISGDYAPSQLPGAKPAEGKQESQ